MARGLLRKPSFWKIVGAYRSQWKRFWLRLFSFGTYGKKGMGWLRNPKKAWYHFWYHRTSLSLPRLLGYKPSWLTTSCALIIASAVSVVASPIDATQAGIKVHKAKAAKKERASKQDSPTNSPHTERPKQSTSVNRSQASTSTSYYKTSQAQETVKESEQKPRTVVALSRPVRPTTTATPSSASTKPTSTKAVPKVADTPIIHKKDPPKPIHTEFTSLYKQEPTKVETPPPAPIIAEPDENTPKSTPKHEHDQYIKKRMIVAGSSYSDQAALDKLIVGSYLELVPEPTNPYDKDAIMLAHNGEKIGYIAKQDKLAFVTCLRLGRKMYGVITDIQFETYPTKYEYETWFDLE